jgi:hypothetical protein
MQPNDSDVPREMSTALDAGAGTEPVSFQNHGAVNPVDPLLLDLRNEQWMSQNIDMTFLDAFLEGTI